MLLKFCLYHWAIHAALGCVLVEPSSARRTCTSSSLTFCRYSKQAGEFVVKSKTLNVGHFLYVIIKSINLLYFRYFVLF